MNSNTSLSGVKKSFILDVLFMVLWLLTQYFTRNILCQLLMVLFFGVVLVFLLQNPIPKLRTTYFWFNILFILWGYIQVQMSIAINNTVAMTMVQSLTLNLMMVFAIVQYALMKNDVAGLLKLVENGTFIVTALVLMITFVTGFSRRLGSNSQINANLLAMLCVYALIICVYLKKNSGKARLYNVKIAVYLVTILLTGSRKGLLMVLIAVFVISMAQGKRKIIKTILVTVMSGIIIYFVIMNVSFLYEIIGVRVESLINMVFSGETEEGSLISRQYLTERGMEFVSKRPIKGYGYDCFKLVSGIGGEGKVSVTGGYGYYSHNNYVELLFSGGVIGLLLYYLPIVFLLIGLVKSIRLDNSITYLAAILVSKLTIEYAYVSYYSRVDAYVFAIILGSYLCVKRNKFAEHSAE